MKGLSHLTRPERLKLMQFVCAAMWSDLEVSHWEKSHILGLALRLGLTNDEVERSGSGWRSHPRRRRWIRPRSLPSTVGCS